MKLLIAFSILISINSFAWEKIISCDGDMFVIDRALTERGNYQYQAVFRGNLVQSMLAQNVTTQEDLNSFGEVVREAGLPGRGQSIGGPISGNTYFSFMEGTFRAPNYTLVFHNRWGSAGDYVFHACEFKIPQNLF